MIAKSLNTFWKELAPFSAKLVAVSKTKPKEDLLEAYDAGNRIFGENKVQEMVAKAEVLPNDIVWHFIGHLQRNKVKFIAPFVAMIHAVDTLKLLKEINKQAKNNNRIVNCLLQVHIAQEETKFGFDANELKNVIANAETGHLTHLKICGLMGMATNTNDKSQIESEFKLLRALFEEIKLMPLPDNIEMKELSMGMSADYKLALEQGSTLVRIGSSIFGLRNCVLNA